MDGKGDFSDGNSVTKLLRREENRWQAYGMSGRLKSTRWTPLS